ncbi:uncharacterized protein LOC121304812 isoform X2 [Polyodon spathula]|uniref:uncharacterized protein LOC121304812 isoform X2 n=1 Tax=Polyodon spathula TaxID=7913 RepID=UPI001B7E2EAB|nr:uncharacterized protein LOC121304812 isoform X2 [Polyodon spathula]
MARALKDGMPERRGGVAGGNLVNCRGGGGGGGGGNSSGTCRSVAVRVESLRRRNSHPSMMGYQQCRRSRQTHSGPDEMGTQPPLTHSQHGTPTPLCSNQHHGVDGFSPVQQRSPSPSQRDVNALPGMLQRNQRPLSDTPRNCSPASRDQNEAQDWHHWRGVWRRLYNFITETLTAAYLPGLR